MSEKTDTTSKRLMKKDVMILEYIHSSNEKEGFYYSFFINLLNKKELLLFHIVVKVKKCFLKENRWQLLLKIKFSAPYISAPYIIVWK